MIIRKQNGYDDFKCIADNCPKSCCEGWQIMIDDNTAKKYKKINNSFKDRIKKGVDFKEQAFNQYEGSCAMLNNNGLCDLQSTLGENYLCDTCRLYPRHIEEFMDIREHSLSLSCPEVINMITDSNYEFKIIQSENEATDDPEEFEDFDFVLFDELEYARDNIFKTVSDKNTPLTSRINLIANIAFNLQQCFDEGDIFSMGDVVDSNNTININDTIDTNSIINKKVIINSNEKLYIYCMEFLDVLSNLEILESSWLETIVNTKEYWINNTYNSSQWNNVKNLDKD